MNDKFIGTAGSFLAANKSYPAILINNDLLLYCGEGTTQKLIKINAIKNISIVCITHLHNDHIGGIFSLIWYYWLSGDRKDLKIIGPPKTRETIEKILDLLNTPPSMSNSFKVDFIEWKDTNQIQKISTINYDIKAIRVEHSILAFAYRIEKNDKSICYSGDTAPSQNLIKLAEDCDLFICESTFPSQFKRIAAKYGHCTPYDLARLANESHSKKVAMVHIASNYLDQIDKFKSQAEKEFGNEIIIAEDLMEIQI
jgi:ribonuclease Z